MMAVQDNWDEFEVKYEDPTKSLEKIEAKVTELEKVQEGVIEEGRKAHAFAAACNANTKLRLAAIAKQQQKLKNLGFGLLVVAGILALFQCSTLLVVSVKGWLSRKHESAEESAGTEEPGTFVKMRQTQRSRYNRRSHAREWGRTVMGDG